jgi:hypothetical protein
MSDVPISAYDPLFWLHHCNVDRFFYNWMYNKTDGFKKKLTSTNTRRNIKRYFISIFSKMMYIIIILI